MPNLNDLAEIVTCLPWAKNRGYDPFMLYSQFRLETGNFTKLPKHNYAGMMYRTDCPYPVAGANTHEWELVAGVNTEVNRVKPFVLYPTAMDFLMDYDNYIRGKFATQAYPFRNNYRAYFNGLIKTKMIGGVEVVDYPSFSSSIHYGEICIERYEDYKKDTELFQLIMGGPV